MPNNTYNSSGAGNWTCPANVTKIVIEAWGAGGGGGGSVTNATTGGGGGGGGGAYAIKTSIDVVPGNTYAYVIPAGGAGGAGAASGTAGAATTFNNNSLGNTSTIIGANGGNGGPNVGGQGTREGGSANTTGDPMRSYAGGTGNVQNGASGGGGGGAGGGNIAVGPSATSRTGATGTNGGGSGGTGGTRNNAIAPTAGSIPGGGGGGAGRSNATATSGAAGGNGQIIVSWIAPTMANGDFESWASATDANTWTEEVYGTSSVNREAASQHGGLYCLRFDIDAAGDDSDVYQTVTLVAGAKYVLSLWYKNPTAGKSGYVSLYDTGSNQYLLDTGAWQASANKIILPDSATWLRYVLPFKAHASYTSYYLVLGTNAAASASVYFDDVELDEWIPRVIII